MVFAAVGDDGYNVVLLIHILAAIIAFAPVAYAPLLERFMRAEGGDAAVQVGSRFSHFYTSRVAMGALVVLLLSGVYLIVLSDEVIEFSDPWISAAFLFWFVIAGVVSGVIGRGERLMGSGDMSGAKLVRIGGPVATVLLVVMLYLMIFKPGA